MEGKSTNLNLSFMKVASLILENIHIKINYKPLP